MKGDNTKRSEQLKKVESPFWFKTLYIHRYELLDKLLRPADIPLLRPFDIISEEPPATEWK